MDNKYRVLGPGSTFDYEWWLTWGLDPWAFGPRKLVTIGKRLWVVIT